MRRLAQPTAGLARHYLVWLIGLAASLTTLIVGCALVFVLWPMAQRSADDLAGLMVLSAQTWVELPPATRPVFEQELAQHHRLALRPDAPAAAPDRLVHGFYIGFLEAALQRRTGQPTVLRLGAAPAGGGVPPWLWTGIPVADRHIDVGFDPGRLDTHPLVALAAVLLVGAALATAAAVWLARRISQPVARLEEAAAALAEGLRPTPLPESGPAELARLAGHFNRMAQQVRELLEARTTLLAGASHDLRTPLARMRLALEMLRLRPGDDRLLQRLEADIEAMDTLIGRMLDLARGLDHEPAQPLALRPWLQAVTQAHEDAARLAGAQLTVACDAGLQAQAAPQALGRVIDNLLGNALRYAAGPVTLSARRLPATGMGPPQLRLTVADRGPGIPPAQRAAVWRPFHRLESSRSPATGGWGLGLAVVRQIADIQGWRVELLPREGGGLEAVVDLPEAPADQPTVSGR